MLNALDLFYFTKRLELKFTRYFQNGFVSRKVQVPRILKKLQIAIIEITNLWKRLVKNFRFRRHFLKIIVSELTSKGFCYE